MGWFERKFEFNYPVEQLPNLMARLRGTAARLDEIAAGAKSLIVQPEGKWSAQEHIGHLLDMEPLWLARVEDFLGDSGVLTPADLTNRKTDLANHNAKVASEILCAFRAERNRLLVRVAGLSVEQLSRSLIHPRLQQPMRMIDHLYFVAEHDDHHIARIFELL